jgi:hypothetical protein
VTELDCRKQTWQEKSGLSPIRRSKGRGVTYALDMYPEDYLRVDTTPGKPKKWKKWKVEESSESKDSSFCI